MSLHNELIKFIKFGLVGCMGMAIDFSITFILKEKLKVNKYISNAIGFLFAASSNFILNRIWTFASHEPGVGLQYLKFVVISVIGLLFSNALIYLAHDRLRINFYSAKMLSVLIVVVWNFLANSFFTF